MRVLLGIAGLLVDSAWHPEFTQTSGRVQMLTKNLWTTFAMLALSIQTKVMLQRGNLDAVHPASGSESGMLRSRLLRCLRDSNMKLPGGHTSSVFNTIRSIGCIAFSFLFCLTGNCNMYTWLTCW